MEANDLDIGFFDVDSECPDMVIENGDLKGEKGLHTAVLISLFSDKFTPFEQLPIGAEQRRGYWADEISDPADDQIGSMLWNTERDKVLLSTVNRIEDISKDGLQWLIIDGIAESVDAVATIIDRQQIDVSIEILKPDEDPFFFKFVWDGQQLRADQDSIG